MFLKTGTYIGSGYVIETFPDSSITNYYLVSLYTITPGPYEETYQINVQDIYTSSNLSTDLYTGLLTGDGNLFAGALGYQGTLFVTADAEGNPLTVEFVQPSAPSNDNPPIPANATIAFFQKQCMAPLTS